jgi:hypothetical protein
MRPAVVIVNQLAISVIADKKIGHVWISTVGSAVSR